MFCGPVVRHFLRKVERGRGQAPALTRTWMEYVGGRETGSQPRNEMEFWPFPMREVKLGQSAFSQRKLCLCHAESKGMGGACVAADRKALDQKPLAYVQLLLL